MAVVACHVLADVPEDDFEAGLAGPGKPSTTGLLPTKPVTPQPLALWVWSEMFDFSRPTERPVAAIRCGHRLHEAHGVAVQAPGRADFALELPRPALVS